MSVEIFSLKKTLINHVIFTTQTKILCHNLLISDVSKHATKTHVTTQLPRENHATKFSRDIHVAAFRHVKIMPQISTQTIDLVNSVLDVKGRYRSRYSVDILQRGKHTTKMNRR